MHRSQHDVLKPGSILSWHGTHLVLLGDGAFQAAGSWDMVFVVLKWSSLSFQQNLPDKEAIQLSSFSEKDTGCA